MFTKKSLITVKDCLIDALKPASKTIHFLLSIMIPVSFAVALLNSLGIIQLASPFLEPFMALLGLPGESALILISSVFLNIYSALAVASQMAISQRSMIIIAIICLTAHNMIIETAVMKKTGSSAIKMILIRLGWAFALGFIFNLILPQEEAVNFESKSIALFSDFNFIPFISQWALSTFQTIIKVVVIVYAVTVAQNVLEKFEILNPLSAVFSPLMTVFGLPNGLSFLWIVINVVGYAYGAGIIEKQVDDKKMTRKESDLFNHHAALCHSLLEDTFLFIAVGVPFFWITIPRILAGIIIVWFERVRRNLFMRSFRVGRM